MRFETTTPAGAKERLDEGWIQLDVRTPEEFDASHAPGAYNIPVALRHPSGQMALNDKFVEEVGRHFPPESQLVLVCAAGMRSARACEMLVAAGYQHLVNMYGGFSGARDMSGQVVERGWQDCGYPVVNGPCEERGYPALQGDKD